MWNFHDSSAVQILHEIYFGHFYAPKTAILTISTALNFEFLGTIDISMCGTFPKIKNSKSPTLLKHQFLTF